MIASIRRLPSPTWLPTRRFQPQGITLHERWPQKAGLAEQKKGHLEMKAAIAASGEVTAGIHASHREGTKPQSPQGGTIWRKRLCHICPKAFKYRAQRRQRGLPEGSRADGRRARYTVAAREG